MKQLVAAVSRKLPRELKNFHLIIALCICKNNTVFNFYLTFFNWLVLYKEVILNQLKDLR